jgi:hypothetical protein
MAIRQFWSYFSPFREYVSSLDTLEQQMLQLPLSSRLHTQSVAALTSPFSAKKNYNQIIKV